MPSKTQLINGNFQDAEGNVLANGYLTFELSQDTNISGSLICAGFKVTINLDSTGNVSMSPAQYIWGTDVMSPSNVYYKVTGFAATGQPAWGPNNQQVISGATFDLDLWVPNQVFSWSPTAISPSVVSVVRQIWTIGDGHTAALLTIGDTNAGAATAGTLSNVSATATQPANLLCDHTGATGGQVAVGITGPAGASNGIYTFGTLGFLFQRLRVNVTSGSRWWVGASFNKASGSVLVSDTPNNKFVGFRYSDGVDAGWTAVCATASSAISTAPTGVTVDTTNPQTFKIVPISGGYTFYINGNLVATISANLPATTDTFTPVVSGDTKGGTQDINFNFFWNVMTFSISL